MHDAIDVGHFQHSQTAERGLQDDKEEGKRGETAKQMPLLVITIPPRLSVQFRFFPTQEILMPELSMCLEHKCIKKK